MKEFEKGVYQTTNYSMFRFMPDGRNRKISKSNTAKKIKSIKEKGLIDPIEVNSRYEIIDGQHRFLACQELGIPVIYRFGRELTAEELAEKNRATARWTAKDYIYTMAASGSETHQYLKCLMEEYPEFGTRGVERALGKALAPEYIGDVTVSQEEYERARKVLSEVRPLWAAIRGEDNITQRHMHVIVKLFAYGIANNRFITDNLLRGSNYKTLKPFSKESEIVRNIEEVCNKGLRNKEYFYSAYLEAVEKSKGKGARLRWETGREAAR